MSTPQNYTSDLISPAPPLEGRPLIGNTSLNAYLPFFYRPALGYKGQITGLCAGYTLSAIDDFFAGKYNSRFEKLVTYMFNNRGWLLAYYKWHLNEFKTQNGCDELQALEKYFHQEKKTYNANEHYEIVRDIRALMEISELHVKPENYSALFGKNLKQRDVLEISTYSSSESLEQLGGLYQLLSTTGIYDRSELKSYIELFINISLIPSF